MCRDDLGLWDISKRALGEVIRLCGGVKALSDAFGSLSGDSSKKRISMARIGHWRNGLIKIPYEIALEMEAMYGVSAARLAPFPEFHRANEILAACIKTKFFPIKVNVANISIETIAQSAYSNLDRLIMVGTNGLLIAGIAQLKRYQAEHLKTVCALVVDLEDLLSEKHTLQDKEFVFLLSECAAVGVRLEQMRHHQGLHRPNLNAAQKIPTLDDNLPLLSRCSDAQGGRTDVRIAKMVGFHSKDSYRRAKQIYCFGIHALIAAVDERQVSLAAGAVIARLPRPQQRDALQNTLGYPTRVH